MSQESFEDFSLVLPQKQEEDFDRRSTFPHSPVGCRRGGVEESAFLVFGQGELEREKSVIFGRLSRSESLCEPAGLPCKAEGVAKRRPAKSRRRRARVVFPLLVCPKIRARKAAKRRIRK